MSIHHRITRCLLALITALVLAWSGPGWTQSKEMDAAYEQYKELKGQGKYAEAIPHAKRFVELVGQEFGEAHQYYALGLNNLAGLYDNQGRYAEAELLFKLGRRAGFHPGYEHEDGPALQAAVGGGMGIRGPRWNWSRRVLGGRALQSGFTGSKLP